MNFEAWQGQQKALKNEERKRKSQAAEALRNYRSDGLSEEEKHAGHTGENKIIRLAHLLEAKTLFD